MHDECPYCLIKKHTKYEVIFKRDLVFYAQDKREQGSLKYSGCIIPTAHRSTTFDLTDEELLACFGLLREVKEWLDKEYKPDGYNIGWNCGEVGGQSVMHAHMHVIPRFKQEPLAGHGIRTHLKSEENRW
ncbi:MAG: HIT family protein [Minisyncoccia bacterium]